MTAPAVERRARLWGMLADLKMPGALEAVDGVLAQVDNGAVTARETVEPLLTAPIGSVRQFVCKPFCFVNH